MATQVSLNDGAVASAGALAIQTNGTTQAVSISTGQVATLAQNPILTSGTANGVAYLNGSKVVTTGSALVFDGSNLGLGVTPSGNYQIQTPVNYNGGAKGFNISSLAGGTSGNGVPYVGYNFRTTGTADSYTYNTADYASAIRFYDGIQFKIAASGTAGNAITFTQAMTLDASGNLGVGQTSMASDTRLHLTKTTDNCIAKIQSSYGAILQLINGGGSEVSTINATGNNVLTLQTGSTERARIDSSGNLGIGTTNIQERLTVQNNIQITNSASNLSGIYFGTNANPAQRYSYIESDGRSTGYISFNTNALERMRIDSSGNLLVGKTATGFTTTGMQLLASGSAQLTTASGGPEALALYRKTSTTTDPVLTLYSDVTSTTAQKLYIQANGSIYNTTGTYGTISDIKLKENIVDATPKLANIMQVKVCNYNLIGDTQKQIGVIAQELEQVFPSMVDESPDRDAEGNDLGTTTKSVKYSVFVPILIKAIQEQQVIIQSLTARITALEGA